MVGKLSKRTVEYTDDHGDSSEQCSKCSHYVNQTTCDIVSGSINPEGWCKEFERE
jgi:hypothetical protein